ncbi:MAG TPA: transketolase C-terminal domain-containing protein [Actinomycetota bacterium]
MKVMEGSAAIAEAVRLARPQVIAAYPITPQTHIVEYLADAVANGELDAEFMTVESEHSAASAVLGASAAGVRTFTATSSQGLLYMAEVVFNIAGMRLPVVMTVANRAISGPLSIWNDHQDSMIVRDAGWMQLYAQNAQEAQDLHLIAYRVAEDPAVSLPVMVCVDGFALTHAFESVEPLTAEQVAQLLPAFQPLHTLDPADPVTMGAYAEPSIYTEARYAVEAALQESRNVYTRALEDLASVTGRRYDPWFDSYRVDDAEVVLVVMGTAAQTARVAVDTARTEGIAAGLLAPRAFRPFPAEEIRRALEHTGRVVVLDRAVSLGAGGVVVHEIRSALARSFYAPQVVGVIAGLGGRDMSPATLARALRAEEDAWIDLREDVMS